LKEFAPIDKEQANYAPTYAILRACNSTEPKLASLQVKRRK